MKSWKILLFACLTLSLCAGCAAKKEVVVPPPPPETGDLIVLLPDPDGKTGVVLVTTQGGSQTLDKAGSGVKVEESGKPPAPSKSLTEEEITTIFGPALSGQPDLTGRFVSFLVYFESDTDLLTQESKRVMSEIKKTVKDRNSKEVFIIGHTDRVGTEEYNLRLSKRRANFVRDQLVLIGIKPDMLFVTFHGESMPLVKTEDEVAEPLNRRVEVFVR